MKGLKILIAGLGVVAACSGLVSCDKTDDKLATENTDMSNSATVQVYVATVNATRNYVYVDGKQVTGATLSSGSVFPVSGTGVGFSVTQGVRAMLVRDTLPTSTQVPLSFSANFAAGKHYTVFTYDTLNTPLQKTVVDDIVIPTDTTARIRFANFPYSPLPVPNVDIYSKRRAANIFTNVAVTDVTPYIPLASALADTFVVRLTGTTTNLQNYTVVSGVPVFADITAILTPTRLRSYTLVFRGGYRTTLTTLGTVRTLSIFAN